MKSRTRRMTWTMIVMALAAFQSVAQSIYEPYTFTTLAGYAGYGSSDGQGTAARFWYPRGAAVDSIGNVYVADEFNHTIRKVTPIGVVTTLVGLVDSSGSADGTGSAARFNFPVGVAVDSTGDIYVADTKNHTIRKVTPEGVVTTLAGLAGISGSTDGTGSTGRFSSPSGVAVDSTSNVYVADSGNHTIRKVTPEGVVTTLAGLAGSPGDLDGREKAARFNNPQGVAVDRIGSVYVSDSSNHTIRKVTQSGEVSTLAGLAGNIGNEDGTGSNALFNSPAELAIDRMDNIYVADTSNHTIRKVTPAGEVTTLTGQSGSIGSADGALGSARFNSPYGVAVNSAGNLYVADTFNSTIRQVTLAGEVTTFAGLARGVGSADGIGSTARFNQPFGIAVDSAGNVYVADQKDHTIRKVTPTGVVTTLAGLAESRGDLDGIGSTAQFNEPIGLAVDSAGNVFVADVSNHTIRKITPAGVVTTLAGLAGQRSPIGADGTGSNARFYFPSDVAVDNAGNVFVADTYNYTLRKVTPLRVVTTLAGLAGNIGSVDGTGSAARFSYPRGVSVDNVGNVYVADTQNFTIRKITSAGVVSTLAGLAGSRGIVDGAGRTARFRNPVGIAVDNVGNAYVSEQGYNVIRKVTPEGVVTTLAGLADSFRTGSADGTGIAARFSNPWGMAVDSVDYVYVADSNNHTIRKGIPASSTPAPILGPPSLNAGELGFGLSGYLGLALDIESSGDLSQWEIVGTYILEGGTNNFLSPTPPHGTQFYRGRVR